MTRTHLAVLTFTLVTAGSLAAQESEEGGRGVARLSLIGGDVSVRRGDTGEWVSAAVNAPLLADDRVLTGANSRAEVQFDYANFARLSGDAELRLADLENRRYLLRVARGTVVYRVLRNQEADAEISTPSIAVRPLKKGMYRVTVLGDGTTEVTVRSGEAEVFSKRGSQKLRSGRTLLARGSYEDPEFQMVDAIGNDDFDRWSDNRDRQLERSKSYSYVSRDIYGAEDLDDHGRWVNTPEYGNVWVPDVSAGWAPYRAGRWAWYDYYGWSWVSYDPWGWAPYHYGRWFFRANVGWAWWPGYSYRRHFWSPALVGFFGWGGRWGASVSFGFGNCGWVPLAPYETFYPWYGRGYYGGFRNRGVINNTTIINNTNITNIYRNARVDNAITAVNANDFGRGSVNAVRVNRNEIESASLMRGQLPLVPDARSTRISDREARVTRDEGRGGNERFFATREASRADRVPFETQRAVLEERHSRAAAGEVAGRGGAGNSGEGGRGASAGTGRVAEANEGRRGETAGRGGDTPASTGRGGENSGGWRRFGESSGGGRELESSGRGSSSRGDAAGRGESTGGWRRFGESGAGSREIESSGRGGGSRGDSSSGSWRRMEEINSGRTTIDSGRGGSDSGWRRMEESSTGRGSSSSRSESVGRGSDSSRGNNDRGGWFGRGGDSGRSSGNSERMNPPVVRERPAPSSDSGRGGFGGFGRGDSGGSGRIERSTPSDGGRGGFGGSRGGDSGGGGRMSAPSGDSGGGRGGFGGGGSRGDSGGGGRTSSGDGGGGRGGGGNGRIR